MLAAGSIWFLLLTIPAISLAAPTWLPPANLAEPGQDAEAPQVATDAAGDAFAAWQSSNGANTVIQTATRPAGAAWEPPVGLSLSGGNASEPGLDADAAGDESAIWRRYNGTHFVIQSSSHSAGGPWSAPANLSPASGDAEAPQIATDTSGESLAVWRLSESGKSIIQAANSGAGASWGPISSLSPEARAAFEPQIGVDSGGDGFAVWKSSNGTNTLIEAATRRAGAPWGGPTELSEAGENASEPQTAVDSAGDAAAVWRRYDGSNYVIQSSLKAAGGSWGPATNLSKQGESADEPQVAMDAGGDVIAVWRRYDGSNYLIEGAYKPSAGGWESPFVLSVPATNAASPEVASDGAGGMVAVWIGGPGGQQIVDAAGKPPGGHWGAPQDVSVIGASATAPKLAADPAGDAVAVWTRAAGGGTTVQGAGYDAAGPELSASIPSAGSARQPASFSAASFDIWSGIAGTHWSFGDGAEADGPNVSHAYPNPGTYPVTVKSVDGVGNETVDSGLITVYPPAWADRLVPVNGRRAALRAHCPNPLGCHGEVTLTAAVELDRHGGHRKKGRLKRRRLIGKAAFVVPGTATKRVWIRLTRAGAAAVQKAERKGTKAQLGGTGLKHRLVLLRSAHASRR